VHPLNNFQFGRATGRIAVKFHNGTSVVTGYVSKQIGTKKFVVSRGALTRTCVLAQTLGELATLAGNTDLNVNKFCTIEITPFGGSVENVASISDIRVVTVQGSKVSYNRGVSATAVGQGTIATYTNSNVVSIASPSNITISSKTATALAFVAGASTASDPLTYKIATLPASGVVSVVDASGKSNVYNIPRSITPAEISAISYFPDVAGNYTVTVTATDGLTSATATQNILVGDLVFATPTALAITTTTLTALNFTAATDPYSSLPVTYTLTGTIPAFGSVRIGGSVVASFPQVVTPAQLSTLSYTAAATRNGSFPITLTATNGLVTKSSTQAITVSGV
jgi:hypothetical protein